MTSIITPTTIKFKGVSGIERTMHIRTLGHREYFETIHLATQVAAGSVTQVGNGLGSNIFTILKTMSFDTFAKVATSVLSGSLLDGFGAVEDPFQCDHFRQHTDELHSATYEAVRALNPELFEKINTEMGPLKFSGKMVKRFVIYCMEAKR